MKTTPARRRTLVLAASVMTLLGLMGTSLVSQAPPVSITIPYSSTPVADANLDGNPATGAWADALSSIIPLENGEPGAYGSATLFTKHNGTTMFLRIDGSIDVRWASPTGNRFWVGFEASTTGTSHHGGGTWDGAFFGLWDGTAYTPQPTYPPPVVDTSGFARPPAKDAVQNALGFLRYSGTAAPYSFTAEWKRPLNSGDANDIVYIANGVTAYNFFVTTDSDGGGSNGGNIAHNQVTNLNTFRIAAPPANTAPVVDLTTPDGGQDWTGGTGHAVLWNMSDAETAVSALRVWLNFSLDNGATYSPIPGAQGITGLTCPCSQGWTTPLADSATVRVRATVVDGGGLAASDVSLGPFTLDSTRPTITGTVPGNGATGVPPTTAVQVAFSEPMNVQTAEQAFSLQRMDTGGYVAGAFSWTGNTLVFTPSAALAQSVTFTGRVNATALDVSDPGNAIASPTTFGFTTVDVAPPTITPTVVPPVQESGGVVNITAVVTDNVGVTGVWTEVVDPGNTLIGNFSMAWDGVGGKYYHAAVYRAPGTYRYRVVARDATGNWAEAAGTFVIQDTTPPTIVHVPPAGAAVGVPVPIQASVSDNNAVAQVRVNYTDVLGFPTNATMTPSGSVYVYSIPAQPGAGTVTYFLWAIDSSGNAARTPAYVISVAASDTTPPSISGVAANPPIQNAPGPTNVTASVVDNVEVASVFLQVTDPLGANVGNISMATVGASGTYYLERVYAVLGTYSFTIWAKDTSGNNASAAGSFVVADLSPPSNLTASATPNPQEIRQAVVFTAQVTDNDRVALVTLSIASPSGAPLGNFTMTFVAPNYTYTASFDALGAHTFTVWATDPAGHSASASGQFTIRDTTPPTVSATGAGTYWIGTTVTFDASASSDNSGIANTSWAFVYNGSSVSLYGPVVAFRFETTGTNNITVTVTDLAGLQASAILRVVIVADVTPPLIPTIESVVPTTPGCLKVTWRPLADIDLAGYRVYRWNVTSASFVVAVDLGPGTTTYEDCGLEYDRVYTYRLTALDASANESPPSRMVNGRTTAPTATPTDLLAYQVAIALLSVTVAGLVVAFVLERRKRNREPDSGPKAPPPA